VDVSRRLIDKGSGTRHPFPFEVVPAAFETVAEYEASAVAVTIDAPSSCDLEEVDPASACEVEAKLLIDV
jgi:hypothetical protein